MSVNIYLYQCLCACVCVCACMFVCVCVCVCVCVYVSLCVSIYAWMKEREKERILNIMNVTLFSQSFSESPEDNRLRRLERETASELETALTNLEEEQQR